MKKKYKWLILGAIAIIIFVSYGAVLLKPVSVEAERIEAGNLENRFTVQASVVPEISQVLNSSSAGSVAELPYKAGMEVPLGAIIMGTGVTAETTLDIQREQANQQLLLAEQEYERNYGPNGAVVSQLEVARNQYELLDKNYNNGKVLADQGGFLSQSELDNLKNLRDTALQTYIQAQENNSETTRSFYQDQINSYKKQVALLEDTTNPGAVKMPYEGILWELYVEKGTYIVPNQPVAKIYQPGAMRLEASVLSEDGALISPGLKAEVTYADGTKGTAEVMLSAKTASQQMSSIGMEENRSTVILKPESVPDHIGAGQKADVAFTVIIAEQVFTIPTTALVSVEGKSIVYVLNDGKGKPVIVETGRKSGGRVEIITGLQTGDIIAADPYNDNVEKGNRVEVNLR
jgi:multidrug resistance efflux pump